jgi:NADPH-dependent 2,4-dienoyl-CoA reductase/sulfur reductase-like enzyme
MVGAGLIGVEMAEMLLARKIPVTFLMRGDHYWDSILPPEEAKLISRHVASHGVDLRLQTELKEIVAGENGRVAAVVTDKDERIACQFVGLTPGVHPNLDAVKNSKIETGKGVLVNEYLETNIPNVYAAGDCAEIKAAGEKNRLEQLWYTGRMQAQALAKTLCGERTKYERGVWYNSAKFFDIEYQTYGFVSHAPRPGEKSFYWEHPAGKHCVHIVYKTDGEEIVGVNLLGIRMRHEVWDWWIREKRTIAEVMENLRAASFDPEFYKTFAADILAAYRQQNPTKNLRLKRQPELLKKFWKGFAHGTRPNPATLNARV